MSPISPLQLPEPGVSHVTISRDDYRIIESDNWISGVTWPLSPCTANVKPAGRVTWQYRFVTWHIIIDDRVTGHCTALLYNHLSIYHAFYFFRFFRFFNFSIFSSIFDFLHFWINFEFFRFFFRFFSKFCTYFQFFVFLRFFSIFFDFFALFFKFS